MPKKIIEINNFLQGITSNASASDIGNESASYSLNVNSTTMPGTARFSMISTPDRHLILF